MTPEQHQNNTRTTPEQHQNTIFARKNFRSAAGHGTTAISSRHTGVLDGFRQFLRPKQLPPDFKPPSDLVTCPLCHPLHHIVHEITAWGAVAQEMGAAQNMAAQGTNAFTTHALSDALIKGERGRRRRSCNALMNDGGSMAAPPNGTVLNA